MRRASLALVAILGSPSAHAQSAEAEILFRAGRDLIKQGKLAEGCDKLDASEKLETSVGTLLNLGDCREKLGMTASAWGAFRKAEAAAKRAHDDQRQAEAGRRATALEPKLTNLVIEVKQPVAGLVVKRDGRVVDPAAWNTAVPIDPKKYTFVAEAPGYAPWQLDVLVDPKIKRRVVIVPVLARAIVVEPRPEPAPEPVPAPVTVEVETPTPRHVYRSRTWSATRKFAAVLTVGGVGGLGAGAYFAVRSRDLRDRSDALCPNPACSDLAALRLNDDAKLAARNANILFVAGGSALAAGVVLWLVGRPDDELVVAPTVGGRGVAVRGRF